MIKFGISDGCVLVLKILWGQWIQVHGSLSQRFGVVRHCILICIYIYVRIYRAIFIYICTHIHADMQTTCMQTCLHRYINAAMFVYIHICVYTYIYIGDIGTVSGHHYSLNTGTVTLKPSSANRKPWRFNVFVLGFGVCGVGFGD